MKALVRSIVMVAILIPLTVNAAPAKKPGKKGGPNAMGMESGKKQKQGKKGKQGKHGSYYQQSQKKKGKHGKQGKYGSYYQQSQKKKGKAVFGKKKGKARHARKKAARRRALARERRRTEALLRGHQVVYVKSWAIVPHVIDQYRFRRLLSRLEMARGPMAKLDILSHAASRRYFTVRQARQLLQQFGRQQVRLEALKVVRRSIIDRHSFYKLLRSFEGRKARRRAAMMLAQL